MAYRVGMLLLTLVAFAWRMDRLNKQSLWRDEIDAVWFATRDLSETLDMFVQAAQNGPLYFLSLRPWFSLVGSSEFALRYPSVLAGVLCVPLLWQLARRLIPPTATGDGNANWQGPGWAPALAATFFAAHPYHLWYAQEGKMYAWVTCFALLTTWLWWQGITQGGRRRWLAYWLAVTLAIYTHLLFVLILPLHFVWFWILWPHSKAHWRGYAGALAGLTLPYIPLLIWQWEFLLASEQMTFFRFTPLAQVGQALAHSHTLGFAPRVEAVWLSPIYFLAGVGVLLGWGEIGTRAPNTAIAPAPWRRYLLLLSWVIVPVACIYALSLRQPVFTERYILWIGPALLILLALGAVAVRTHAFWLARPITLVLCIYVLGFWLHAGWQQKNLPMKYDLRSGVTYVAERREPGELLMLQIPHLAWAYGYYTSDQGPRPFEGSDARLGHWLGGLWTNNDWPDEVAWNDVQARMEGWTAQEETLWLLRSEPEMWDSRRLLDRWLEQNAQVIDSADFPGIQARRYRLVE